MRKALVVGIDDYSRSPLSGCVNDAIEVGAKLETNGDGSPNFAVVSVTSNNEEVTSARLIAVLEDLFTGDADTVLFYFAGHGIIDPTTNAGYIVTQDGAKPNWGISLSEILEMANKAYPRIKSSVIILDSCQSGFAGEIAGLGNDNKVSQIGNGVTILTACQREGYAEEGDDGGHGAFTSILLDGLSGASADVIGRITPASLYTHIDQTLGPWKQRPMYKANVQSFIALRQISPKVPLEVLRRLINYFPDATDVFDLDPSFEPNRGEEAERLKAIPVIEDNVRIYRELQQCYQNSLVVPLNQPHMWHAAVYSTGCRLTATGVHYRKLAEMKRI
jgi:hypothetical protein